LLDQFREKDRLRWNLSLSKVFLDTYISQY
jgi:hypothetical protein